MRVEKKLYKNFLGEFEYCLQYRFSGRKISIPLRKEEAIVLFGDIEIYERDM
ncbi:MAG: hypothetical protein ACP5E8_02225 [Thermoplasmata archaeon]